MGKLDDTERPAPPPDREGQSEEPKRLGGFELLGRLGKGGMGTVLKARQVSMDRLVALKILPKKLAENETFVQRFVREARSAAHLRHPNIVQAFDVGVVDGYHFFAMEFVDGETLSDMIARDGPLEPSRALDIMKQVTSALAAAHEEGIVHRDIKPSNIMIDKKGEVRVTDFGLAKRTEGDVAVTADGTVLGSPGYVSPEMAKGGHADARSDLYSLGATFFHVLAGRPPFEGKNFSEIVVKQATEPAPPLASLAPRVDRRLCHIVDRLLRKNPEARHPSATALLDELNGLGKLQSVAAAARAEGRAMIAEAPTLEMTDAKRREREARTRQPRAKSSRTPLIALGVIAALFAVVVILVVALRPNRKPSDTAASGPPTPNTEHPTPTVADNGDAQRKAAERAEQQRLAKARQQSEELLKQADAAIAAKDFSRARAIIKFLEALDLADFGDEARKKLAEIASREKSAAEWAKWDETKAAASKLIADGKLDEAEKLLDAAKALPLDGIADLVAKQMELIETARLKAAQAALAAYQAESDKLWALFKERKYPEADKLLSDVARRAAADGIRDNVDRRAAADLIRDGVAGYMKADQEALALLKEFWAAVESGIAARKGSVSIKGAVGNITAVDKGVITIQTLRKESLARSIYDLDAKQALAYAAVVLKDDERSHLAEAIFRIAEGEDPDAAAKALAAAGNPPGLSFYKDRLDALTLGAAEVAARKAWAEIEALAKGKLTKAQTAALGNLLDKFEKDHGQSKTSKQVTDQIAALRARAGKAAGPIVYTEWPFDATEAKRRQAETAKALGVPVEQDIDLGKGVKITFVLIPAGEFLMGSPPTTSPEEVTQKYGGVPWISLQSEFPQHLVRISKPLWMQRTELTQAQWQAVMGTNPSGQKEPLQNPVEHVNWDDCERFLQKLSQKSGRRTRLPTEAEWEYACRAGAASEFCFGNDAARLEEYGWCCQGARGRTHPVGTKKANSWGMYDMHGNLWEWCQDWLGPYERAPQTDPKGPEAGVAGRVLRGGSQFPDAPAAYRCAARRGGFGERDDSIGFRAAMEQDTLARPLAGPIEGKPGEWQSLFDEKTLAGWKIVDEGLVAGHGKVYVQGGQIVLERGNPVTAMGWKGALPESGYEVCLDAKRIEGTDLFLGLEFQVGGSRCHLDLGGGGGRTVGLFDVDGRGLLAKPMSFQNGRWYCIRIRVTDAKVEAWIDQEMVINLDTRGKQFGLPGGWPVLGSLGICNWETKTAYRNIKVRSLAPGSLAKPLVEETKPGEWQSLFDGKALGGWQKFEGHGQDMGTVSVKDGEIVVGKGNVHAGIVWTQDFPKCDYELELKVDNIEGYDTPCQLTFPVEDSFCTLFYRSGTAASLGKIGGKDFPVPDGKGGAKDQWYALRLRVTKAKIGVWVDEEQVLDVAIPEGAAITCDKPDWKINRLNIRTWKTTAAYRDLRVRRLGAE